MDLKLGHYNKDGIEVVDVEGEIDIYTAPRLRELLIDLVSKGNYQLVVGSLSLIDQDDSCGISLTHRLAQDQGYTRDFPHALARPAKPSLGHEHQHGET